MEIQHTGSWKSFIYPDRAVDLWVQPTFWSFRCLKLREKYNLNWDLPIATPARAPRKVILLRIWWILRSDTRGTPSITVHNFVAEPQNRGWSGYICKTFIYPDGDVYLLEKPILGALSPYVAIKLRWIRGDRRCLERGGIHPYLLSKRIRLMISLRSPQSCAYTGGLATRVRKDLPD